MLMPFCQKRHVKQKDELDFVERGKIKHLQSLIQKIEDFELMKEWLSEACLQRFLQAVLEPLFYACSSCFVCRSGGGMLMLLSTCCRMPLVGGRDDSR